MEAEHKKLINEWADSSILRDLETMLVTQLFMPSHLGWDFRTRLYPLMRDLDSRIPGVGMHYVAWRGATPHFPFPGKEFDGVVRTLRYIPYYLASQANLQMMARSVAEFSGAHVEQCVKLLSRTRKKSLGVLVRQARVKKRLGDRLALAIGEYVPSWNQAKHEYGPGTTESVVPIESAIGNYYTARVLGAKALDALGKLDSVVEATHAAANHGTYYKIGSLPERPDAMRHAGGRYPR